jgi:hypothetical protein
VPRVFRCFTGIMTQISCRAADLKTGQPQVGAADLNALHAASFGAGKPRFSAPDLTERRIVIVEFPKDAGERDCYRFLVEQMRASADVPRERKMEFKRTCRTRFRVTVASFEDCSRGNQGHWRSLGSARASPQLNFVHLGPAYDHTIVNRP